MAYVPITPFRRTIDAVQIRHQQAAQGDLPPDGVNKWEVLRELGVAQSYLGVTDRELIVLQALLSFHAETILGANSPDLVVYPSNAAICERLNGMASSTMRRHLSGLVQAGLIIRRDSPNGKRYARRYGDEKEAFGFDLSPLARRFPEICAAAEAVRVHQNAYKRLRQTVSLMRRDLAGLVAYGLDTRPDLALWDPLEDLARLTARDLRRNLSMAELGEIEGRLAAALDQARRVLDAFTQDMSINDVQNEQHHQNSNPDSYDLEPCLEKAGAQVESLAPEMADDANAGSVEQRSEPGDEPAEAADIGDDKLPNVPLGLVLAVCAEIKTYVPDRIRHWHQLVRAAELVRPMMGISPSAWDEAAAAMGPEEAAVVVAAMLERFSEIQSPGGYLRHLTRKAEVGEFSCGPMVMALLRREAA